MPWVVSSISPSFTQYVIKSEAHACAMLKSTLRCHGGEWNDHAQSILKLTGRGIDSFLPP